MCSPDPASWLSLAVDRDGAGGLSVVRLPNWPMDVGSYSKGAYCKPVICHYLMVVSGDGERCLDE